MLRKSEDGFTLVELIIVIVIIGILAGISVLSLGYVSRKSVSNQCITNYQALSLAYSSYQSDNGGASPGELVNLSTNGYLNNNLIVNPRFTLQNSLYQIVGYSISGTTNTLTISASWLSATRPPMFATNSVINISNLAPQLNGTFNLLSAPVYASGTSYTLTYTLDPTVDVSTIPASATYTDNPNPPRTLNIFTTATQTVTGTGTGPTVPYEIFVFDSQGNVKSGIAPGACQLLTG